MKQSDPRQGVTTVVREAHAYDQLWTYSREFASRYMPKMQKSDEDRALLILDQLDRVESANDINSHSMGGAIACATELGRALAWLHQPGPQPDCDFEAPIPWVLSVIRPDWRMFGDLSGASIAAIQIAQQSATIQRGLADLASSAAPRTLIHGDMRLSNCLARYDSGDELRNLFIVDWELAGIGDSCYDIGSVFCDYLTLWVCSMPIAPALALRDSLALAATPLSHILANLRTFWGSYHSYQRGSTSLIRSVRWTGARLLQSAIETAQASAALSSTVVILLQLAENVIGNPEGGVRLMGLDVGS